MKSILILSGAFGAAFLADASLITGWTFNQVDLGSAPAGNILPANVSDQFVDDGVAFDGSTGTLFFNGEYGSTSIPPVGVLEGLTSSSGNLTGNRSRVDGGVLENLDLIDGPGKKLSINNYSTVTAEDKSIVFAAYAAPGFIFDGPLTLSYGLGKLVTTGATDVSFTWETSLNGVDYVSSGVTDIANVADKLGSKIVSGDASGLTAAFFRVTFDNIGANRSAYIDNLQINGDLAVIPEPSSVMGLLGLAALGVVARRRRR